MVLFPTIQKRTQKKEVPCMDKTVCGTQNGIAATGWPKAFFYLIQFTWGLTINLVGLLVFLCCRIRCPSKRFRNSIVTCLPGNRGGLSLGIFIFLSGSNAAENSGLCAHEYGHTVQCLFLGPLYWLVVAIPSVIWCNLFVGYRNKHRVPYDFLYCERWATAWGIKWSGI